MYAVVQYRRVAPETSSYIFIDCRWKLVFFSLYVGRFSSIHRCGRLVTFTVPPTSFSASLSANRFLSRRAGQGKIFEAETVTIDAKNVIANNVEMNVRRWVNLMVLFNIVCLGKSQKNKDQEGRKTYKENSPCPNVCVATGLGRVSDVLILFVLACLLPTLSPLNHHAEH